MVTSWPWILEERISSVLLVKIRRREKRSVEMHNKIYAIPIEIKCRALGGGKIVLLFSPRHVCAHTWPGIAGPQSPM